MKCALRTAVVGLALLLAVAAARTVESGRNYYYWIEGGPSLAIVDRESLTRVGSIPLEHGGGEVWPRAEVLYGRWPRAEVLLGAGGNYAYVLQRLHVSGGPFDPQYRGMVSVVDLSGKRTVKTIPAGWNPAGLFLSKDKRLLLCPGQGLPGSKKFTREGGALTIIDTQTNEVKATLGVAGFLKQVAMTDDASTIFMLNMPKIETRFEDHSSVSKGDPPLVPALSIFRAGQDKPESVVTFEDWPSEMVLSANQQWLYVLERGKPAKDPTKNRDGVVHVIEVASGKLVRTHRVGTSPRSLDPAPNSVLVLSEASPKSDEGRLHLLSGSEMKSLEGVGANPLRTQRFEGLPGTAVIAAHEMRFLNDDGALSPTAIHLNKRSGDASLPSIGGLPADILYLPRQNKLVMTSQSGESGSTGIVSIVNLASNRLECAINTSHGGGGRLMKELAISAMSGAVAGSYAARGLAVPSYITDAPAAYANRHVQTALAAAPDEQTVYALNSDTAEVTTINPADGAVRARIPVVKGSTRILVTPNGRFLVVLVQGKVKTFSAKYADSVTLIETKSNVKEEYAVANVRLNSVYMDRPRQRILCLTEGALMVIDAESGKLLRTVEAVGELSSFVSPEPE